MDNEERNTEHKKMRKGNDEDQIEGWRWEQIIVITIIDDCDELVCSISGLNINRKAFSQASEDEDEDTEKKIERIRKISKRGKNCHWKSKGMKRWGRKKEKKIKGKSTSGRWNDYGRD